MIFPVAEYIRNVRPYVPGKPIEETRREYKLKRVIKLASNENPLGPSPKALQAVRAHLKDSHRYPDASHYELKQALARHHRVGSKSGLPSSTQFIIGNGSNEIIDFILRTFCVPGDAMVTSVSAFVAYRICAQIQGVRTLEVPQTQKLCFDLERILETVRGEPRARVVFLPNPNNPTGTYVPEAELRTFLTKLRALGQSRGTPVLCVLDAAYQEYVTAKDLADPDALLKDYADLLLVLRTFSKVYGLSGFRIGYGMGAEALVSDLERVRQPFNVNQQALVAAIAALQDRAFVKRSLSINRKGMALWEKALNKWEIPYWPSQGNFLLIDVLKASGLSGIEVYERCLRHGVIFRPVANYGLGHALRVSIGTLAENRLAIQVLGAALGRVKKK